MAAYKNPKHETLLMTHATLSEALRDKTVMAAFNERSMRDAYKRLEAFNEKLSNRELILDHGDPSHDNILLNPETKRLSKIFDFGYTTCTYPEEQWLYFRVAYDPAFAKMVCTSYAALSGEKFSERNLTTFQLAQQTLKLADAAARGDTSEAENARGLMTCYAR
jgi:thiamine kinase-like enzyme